jgi:hypothetical protein
MTHTSWYGTQLNDEQIEILKEASLILQGLAMDAIDFCDRTGEPQTAHLDLYYDAVRLEDVVYMHTGIRERTPTPCRHSKPHAPTATVNSHTLPQLPPGSSPVQSAASATRRGTTTARAAASSSP